MIDLLSSSFVVLGNFWMKSRSVWVVEVSGGEEGK